MDENPYRSPQPDLEVVNEEAGGCVTWLLLTLVIAVCATSVLVVLLRGIALAIYHFGHRS